MSEGPHHLAKDLGVLRNRAGKTYRDLSVLTGHGLRTLVASTKGEKVHRYILLAIAVACGCSKQERDLWDERWYVVSHPDAKKPEWFTALSQFQSDLNDLVCASGFSYRALSDRAGLSSAKVSMMLGDETLCPVEDLLAVVRVLGGKEDVWNDKWRAVNRLTGVRQELGSDGSLVLKIPSSQIIQLAEGSAIRVTVSIEKL